jgi:ligand-binding sensor protein
MFRPFLSNIYIIADDYLNNGELMNRFKNAKFLIFDEDINSGATLKIVIDALTEKLPEQSSSNLMCLVNAYSGSCF